MARICSRRATVCASLASRAASTAAAEALIEFTTATPARASPAMAIISNPIGVIMAAKAARTVDQITAPSTLMPFASTATTPVNPFARTEAMDCARAARYVTAAR